MKLRMQPGDDSRLVPQDSKALDEMLSLGFTLLLINGFLFVAYLKIICCSEMPYNIIPQLIRAVFNYKLERTLEVGKMQESCGGILMPIFLWFISRSHFSCEELHMCASVIDKASRSWFDDLVFFFSYLGELTNTFHKVPCWQPLA